MDENIAEFGLNVLLVVCLLFLLIIFIHLIGLNLNMMSPSKKLIGAVTIESMISQNQEIPTKSDAFCESHRGSSNVLNDECQKLTERNCLSTSCCVYTSEGKCLAGGSGGPTFNSDSNGKTKNLDYYYFQNKCYGPKCPN